MKPQWQQQQAQMRRQQEQLRQKQMGAAWLEQQKEKQQPTAGVGFADDPFAQIEQAVASLRQQLAAGRLTQEQVEAQMENLMIQDDEGVWWTIGFETGEWYRRTGDAWTPATPRPAAGQAFVSSLADAPKPHRFGAVIVWLIGIALTAGAGMLAGTLAFEGFGLGDVGAWVAAGFVWLVGLRITTKISGKIWRGK